MEDSCLWHCASHWWQGDALHLFVLATITVLSMVLAAHLCGFAVDTYQSSCFHPPCAFVFCPLLLSVLHIRAFRCKCIATNSDVLEPHALAVCIMVPTLVLHLPFISDATLQAQLAVCLQKSLESPGSLVVVAAAATARAG